MKTLSIAEIIEQARDRVYMQQEAERKSIAEKEEEFSLGFCYDRMKAWRKWYFKKTCSKSCSIRVICNSWMIEGSWYFKHTLQLFRGGELQEEFRIRAEAFDTLTRGRERDHNSEGTDFYTLEIFEPIKK